ncbi:MAG: hypothetical protein D6689_08490 [Deltaproteobacteria bacterium]|nr:MAG: hypothetical protein D6689_08490 [Deltaproteobacteria bacterium]
MVRPPSFRFALPSPATEPAYRAFVDRLPYCSPDIERFAPDVAGRAFVDVWLRPGGDGAAVEARLAELYAAIARGAFRVPTEVWVDRRDRAAPPSRPVLDDLIARRWLVPFDAGRVALQGPALALYDYFDEQFEAIAAEFGAARAAFPTLISIETLERAEYLQSFPHHITLAPPLRGDSAAIDAFRRSVAGGGSRLASAAEPDHVLSPTVCIHCYEAVRGRRLAPGELVCATAIGNCFRHERDRLDCAARLWDFHMREIIFIGDRDRVARARADSVDRVTRWLDELGMRYWIETATDPFFIDRFAPQAYFQLANKTKFELLVDDPGGDRPLALGSFNVHHDFFGSAFGLSLAGGEPADTGCTAFGVERFVYAFATQHGLDPARWPEPVCAFVASRNLSCL